MGHERRVKRIRQALPALPTPRALLARLARLAPPALLVVLALFVLLSPVAAALRVEVLRPAGGLPAHIAAAFDEAADFQQTGSGDYFVFDRRNHSVHVVDAAKQSARKIVDIGAEDGRIIQPSGFDVSRDGRILVADVPRARQRVQTFDATGAWRSGFFLPGQPAARVMVGPLMLNGAGSVQLAGRSLLVSHPESGALFTEYSIAGYPQRSVGGLRATGHEADREIHLAMNAGLPLVDPTGGFFFVFLAGTPMFHKYDQSGALLFARYIQGAELDPYLAVQPTRWPRRQVQDRTVPFVTPVVRAAAVSDRGELWVSLGVPYTYVFDGMGDKIRTVQFRATGTISPTSLSFAPNGRLLVTPGCYEFDPRQPA